MLTMAQNVFLKHKDEIRDVHDIEPCSADTAITKTLYWYMFTKNTLRPWLWHWILDPPCSAGKHLTCSLQLNAQNIHILADEDGRVFKKVPDHQHLKCSLSVQSFQHQQSGRRQWNKSNRQYWTQCYLNKRYYRSCNRGYGPAKPNVSFFRISLNIVLTELPKRDCINVKTKLMLF